MRPRVRTASACRSSRAAPAPGSPAARTPVAGGVVISLARMNRILEIDLESQRVVVEPGVANLDVTRGRRGATASSTRPIRRASRSARSAATSPRTRAARTASSTASPSHHVTGLTLVLPDGEIVELGGKALDPDGPDLLGVVRRLRGDARDRDARSRSASSARPRPCATLLAGFHTMDAAGAAVSGDRRRGDPARRRSR